jgi:hypothetical protein
LVARSILSSGSRVLGENTEQKAEEYVFDFLFPICMYIIINLFSARYGSPKGPRRQCYVLVGKTYLYTRAVGKPRSTPRADGNCIPPPVFPVTGRPFVPLCPCLSYGKFPPPPIACLSRFPTGGGPLGLRPHLWACSLHSTQAECFVISY